MISIHNIKFKVCLIKICAYHNYWCKGEESDHERENKN